MRKPSLFLISIYVIACHGAALFLLSLPSKDLLPMPRTKIIVHMDPPNPLPSLKTFEEDVSASIQEENPPIEMAKEEPLQAKEKPLEVAPQNNEEELVATEETSSPPLRTQKKEELSPSEETSSPPLPTQKEDEREKPLPKLKEKAKASISCPQKKKEKKTIDKPSKKKKASAPTKKAIVSAKKISKESSKKENGNPHFSKYLGDAKNYLNAINGTGSKKGRGKGGNGGSLLTIPTLTFEVDGPLEPAEESYRALIGSELKSRLHLLPEGGELSLKLTLSRDGGILKVSFAKNNPSQNKEHVEKALQGAHFPPFQELFKNESSHTFSILLTATE